MDNSNECRPFKYVVTPEEEILVRNTQNTLTIKMQLKLQINMFNENYSIDMIIKATGLTEENLEIIK